jgi:hypothetical protein
MNASIKFATAICLLFVLAGCSTATSQRRFASPTDAVNALSQAATSENDQSLKEIFGEEYFREVSSGDPVADRHLLRKLASLMKQEQQLVPQEDGSQIIAVGKKHWPFPAPIVERDGAWIFDTERGANEVIDRRIGENELRAIKLAHFYVDAQRLYHSRDRTGNGAAYAQRMISSAGKKDGLYWPASPEEVSPLAPLVGVAVSEGYNERSDGAAAPYQGYFYKVLTRQGANARGGEREYVNSAGLMTDGFAMMAYPSRWGVSGIMTFLVSSDGTIYEKNLGPPTSEIAPTITAFNPDPTWLAVND